MVQHKPYRAGDGLNYVHNSCIFIAVHIGDHAAAKVLFNRALSPNLSSWTVFQQQQALLP